MYAYAALVVACGVVVVGSDVVDDMPPVEVDPPLDGNVTSVPLGNSTVPVEEAPEDVGVPVGVPEVTEAPATPAPVEVCGYDYHVVDGECKPCPYNWLTPGGDNPAGGNTNCTKSHLYIFGIKVTNETDKTPPQIFEPSLNLEAKFGAYFLSKDATSRNLTFRQLCTYGPGVETSQFTYPGDVERCEVPGGDPVPCETSWCEYVIWASVRTTDKNMLIHVLTDPAVDWKALGIYGAVEFVEVVEVSAGSTKVVEVGIGRWGDKQEVFRKMVGVVAGVKTEQVVVYKFSDSSAWFQVVSVDTETATSIEAILKAELTDAASWMSSVFQPSGFSLVPLSALTPESSKTSTPIWAAIVLAIAAGILLLGVLAVLAMNASCPCIMSDEEKIEAAEERIRKTNHRTTFV